MPLAVSALLPSVAQAQSVWGGNTSTTITPDYNLTTNWSNGVSTSAGDAAVFDATGNTSVVTSGTIAPDSWTFNAASQNYTVTGSAVNFGIGLTNNASAGQAISIANNMTGPTLSQAGASTLTLTGTNSFANTTISAGTLALSGGGSLGNSLVTLGTDRNYRDVRHFRHQRRRHHPGPRRQQQRRGHARQPNPDQLGRLGREYLLRRHQRQRRADGVGRPAGSRRRQHLYRRHHDQ